MVDIVYYVYEKMVDIVYYAYEKMVDIVYYAYEKLVDIVYYAYEKKSLKNSFFRKYNKADPAWQEKKFSW